MMRTATYIALAAIAALIGVVLLPANAYALSVSNAQLKGGQLRVDGAGAAPNIFVMVESSTSTAGIRADSSGRFHVEASGFRADDCTVVVSDRRTLTDTVTLTGCTPTAATPPPNNPAPTGSCVITPGAAASYHLGDMATYFFTTTGCDTSNSPVQWTFLAGRIPVGMSGPYSQGQTAGAVNGRPTTEGSYSFTVQVTDSAGATDTETFSIAILAPRPVTVTTQSAPAGTVGQAYWINLAADGGLPGYLWTLRSGTLPPGLDLTTRGALAGTPSARGTFTFTVGATDSRGTLGTRTFSVTVG